MKNNEHNTIGIKLMGMMLVTLLLALLIIISGVLLHKYITDRNSLEQQLLTLAQVIASRSTGAIEFEDTITATENLNALSASPDIVTANLILLDGGIFASFNRSQNHPDRWFSPLYQWLKPTMEVHYPVELDDVKIAELHITASLDRMINDLNQYILLTLLISGVAFLLAFILFYRLHRSISLPIANLINAMVRVTQFNQYDIRVNEDLPHDIGLLNQGFNNMLQQIEMRDQQLAHHQTHLQAEIERQSQEIAESHKQRIFWLESMASFLQHELKNSTVGVKTSLDLIERRQHSGIKLDTYLMRARKSMQYMNSLLQSASEASTLEAAVYKDELQPLDLSALLNQLCNEYQMDYQQVLFSFKISSGLYIKGNADRISQLFEKLVTNAIDHKQADTAIEIELQQDKERAILVLSNKGNALPENKSRLFELFFSMRKAENRQESNVGLGLYVVRLIAECHGGEVHAYDREECDGATFKVTFPLIS